MSASVTTGLEKLLTSELDAVAGKAIGLIANPTTVDGEMRHAIDLLHDLDGVELRILFGPEHGLRATVQDLIEVSDGTDPITGIPVLSLYGPIRIPTEEMLSGLDAVVFDIQDIGSRYYTYIWTMAHAMEACARDGVELIVLDRPNPIGGDAVEGNLIDAGHLSFVGLYPIPNRHGMTSGELALFLNGEFGIDCPLKVISMEGWKRRDWFDDTGLTWVMPSPNMPTVDTATVYPGACLFEGTNLSEGRGTTRPFELVGAPWLDAEKLSKSLAAEDLPGVRFRPVCFVPTFHKFSQQQCMGVQQHVFDRMSYRPVRTGYAIVRAAREQNPSAFDWRSPPYEYELVRPAIDILTGSETIRKALDSGSTVEALEASWREELERFRSKREPYLLYE